MIAWDIVPFRQRMPLVLQVFLYSIGIPAGSVNRALPPYIRIHGVPVCKYILTIASGIRLTVRPAASHWQ